jgi:hypothetical protein
MGHQPSSTNNPSIVPASFTEKLFREPEEENLLNEGNLWFSHRKVRDKHLNGVHN